jgi:hypothetical protein
MVLGCKGGAVGSVQGFSQSMDSGHLVLLSQMRKVKWCRDRRRGPCRAAGAEGHGRLAGRTPSEMVNRTLPERGWRPLWPPRRGREGPSSSPRYSGPGALPGDSCPQHPYGAGGQSSPPRSASWAFYSWPTGFAITATRVSPSCSFLKSFHSLASVKINMLESRADCVPHSEP